METSVSQIGCQVGEKTLNTGQTPLFAELVRKKSNDRFLEIVEGTKSYLREVIMNNADKNQFTFDMKKFVGNKFSTECSSKQLSYIENWLYSEGFIVNGHVSNTDQLNTLTHSFISRRVQQNYIDSVNFILKITW